MLAKRKIRHIEELARLLESDRSSRRVVHCHGVFDLLHIGHIRHFEQAKELGDILVVTTTPDRYVNKGPHRPVFNEQLRAEAVAALDCVDYVAVNNWPMAVEAIKLLRPDFYVKGGEYREHDEDVTGGIRLEEEAVESVGGRLAFTDDITFSSSSLINSHLSPLPKEVSDYLAAFSRRNSISDVLGYLDKGRSLKTLVVGEAIIDEYHYCEAIGKSSKEPTLALKYLSTERMAGGILAVANHIASFDGQVGLVTFLGADDPQEEFIRDKVNPRIDGKFLYRQDSLTIVKQRFIESYHFTKHLEVYNLNDEALDEADNQALCTALDEQLDSYDVVVVVDYGHGMMSKEAIDILCDKAPFLAVNAQSNAGNMGYHTISRYPRADYVCVAENELRLEARDRHASLRDLVLELTDRLSYRQVVVTRGKYGCLCYSPEDGFFEVPALASQVTDRIGAGDAFIALTALCSAQRAPMEVLGFIGNAVGAQAVATVGNRVPVARVPLVKHIESLLK